MASIQGFDPNDPNKNNQPALGTGASSQVQTQGPSTTQNQPAKGTSSGSFQNFGNYSKANKQAGEKVGNVLSQNIKGQAQSVRSSTGAIQEQQTAAQKEQDRIKQGLEKVRGAVSTGQGFQEFFQQGPATNAPVAGQANNPVYSNLADWAGKLSTGQTDAAKLQQQAEASGLTAQRQLGQLQNQQQNISSEAGRFQLLKDILGKTGGYSNPAARLDQALLQTNVGNLNKVIKDTQQSVVNEKQALQTQRDAMGTELSNLDAAKLASLKELRGDDTQTGLLSSGLGNVDTALAQQQIDATTARKASQEDITKQFSDQAFAEDTAGQLGIGEGTTLFNLLKESPEAYKKYVSMANPEGIEKSNVINENQLTQYAALQKMLGKDSSEFAYKGVGKVDPAYQLQGNLFKQDLGNLYRSRADQAESDIITGQAKEHYVHGLFNSVTDQVHALSQARARDAIDAQTIRDAAKQFDFSKDTDILGELSNVQEDVLARDSQKDAITRGVGRLGQIGATALTGGAAGALGGAMGAGSTFAGSAGTAAIKSAAKGGGNLVGDVIGGVGGIINEFADMIFTGGGAADKKRHATQQAREHARQDLQNQWQNYINSRGYMDTASIRKALGGTQG